MNRGIRLARPPTLFVLLVRKVCHFRVELEQQAWRSRKSGRHKVADAHFVKLLRRKFEKRIFLVRYVKV